ncbi:3'(2'),5'-bisphosphate nucleotidase [compost metagenome]
MATWRTAEQRVRPWTGDYLMVACAALGRTDRAALRERERILQLLGFQELDKGLYIRPDNIETDAQAVRQRLLNLGLEPQALLFVGSQLDEAREADIRQMWNGQALNEGYLKTCQQLVLTGHRWCWVVDPNDGTSDFLKDRKGSAISIGLLHNALPVLGVVYAPVTEDCGADCIAWAREHMNVRE